MDDVQYTKKDWRNTNQLKSQYGAKNVHVPVRKTTRDMLINQVYISYNEPWEDALLNRIKEWYNRSPHFEEIYDIVKTTVLSKYDRLVDLNFALNNRILDYLGMRTSIRFTSEFPKDQSQNKNARIIGLCKFFGTDLLYDGKSAQNFIDRRMFRNAGITVVFQDYRHVPYRQQWGDFVPYMSVLDLLMNEGKNALSVILSSPRPDFEGAWAADRTGLL